MSPACGCAIQALRHARPRATHTPLLTVLLRGAVQGNLVGLPVLVACLGVELWNWLARHGIKPRVSVGTTVKASIPIAVDLHCLRHRCMGVRLTGSVDHVGAVDFGQIEAFCCVGELDLVLAENESRGRRQSQRRIARVLEVIGSAVCA